MPSDQRMVFYQGPLANRPREASDDSQQSQEKKPPSSRQWVRFKEYEPKAKDSKRKPKPKKAEDPPAEQSSSSEIRAHPRPGPSQQLTRRQQPVDPTTNQHLLVLPQRINDNDPDPFNVLPSRTDPYAARMLQLYIDPKVLTALFSRSTPEVPTLWLEQRKQHWLPLAMGSPAALNALIVFMETCPGMPPVDPLLHRRRLASAYNALNEDLRHPERQASDSTAFAVILLMNASEHMADFDAFRSHSFGLEAIVARRRSLPLAILPKSRPDISYVAENLQALQDRDLVRPELIAHLKYWHAAAMSYRVLGRDDKILALSSSHMMTTGQCFGGELWPIEAVFSEALKLYVF